MFIFNIFIENNVWVKKLCWKEGWNRYQSGQPSTVLTRQVSSWQWARYKHAKSVAKTALSGFSVLQAQRAVHEIGLGQPPSSQINLRLFIQLQAHRKPLLTCSRSYIPLCCSISVYVLICLSICPHILPCSSITPHVLPDPPPQPSRSHHLPQHYFKVLHLPPHSSLFLLHLPLCASMSLAGCYALGRRGNIESNVLLGQVQNVLCLFFLQGSGRNARNAQCHTKVGCLLASEHRVRSLLAVFVELGCVCSLAGSFLTDPGTETRPCSGSVSTNNVHVPQ